MTYHITQGHCNALIQRVSHEANESRTVDSFHFPNIKNTLSQALRHSISSTINILRHSISSTTCLNDLHILCAVSKDLLLLSVSTCKQ